MSRDWRQDVYKAIRDAKIRVVGQDDIKNNAQGRVAAAVIEAYGASSAGFVYIEPYTARSTKRPPDVLLCHPDVGVLVVEVKGYPLEAIQGIEAGKLFVRERGYNRPKDPFSQASEAMFNIKNEVERILRRHGSVPLFNFMAALPNISESAWASKGYDRALPSSQLLFEEHVHNSRRIRQRVSMLVKETLAEAHKDVPLTAEDIEVVERALGKSTTINECRPPRSWVDERKLGAYVDEMVALDKYKSAEQQELSRLKVGEHPRLIRGVAGSGKTVVLAEMVARFVHRRLSQPRDMFSEAREKPRVAVVCFNRSLVPFIHRKIRDSYEEQAIENLPGDTVLVTHLNGLLWHLIKNERIPVDYIRITGPGRVDDNTKRATIYRERIRQFATGYPEWYKAMLYDAIFVDEGQDFEDEEYRLLLDLIKTNPKTGEKPLVIFYDDAQNLYARPRPNWKEVGINVRVGDRARVMKECFRNTREVVELAFNVLLGSQAPPNVRVETRTYADVNYLKQLGLVEELGDHFRVRFSERTFHQKPLIHSFSSRFDEKQWIGEEVVRLIDQEQVRPEDLLVLFHRSGDFEDLCDIIMAQARSDSIAGFIRPYGNSPDVNRYIFREDHLTVSTTHGAKGYDSQIVFVAGADLFDTGKEGRASFYVGATRAKMLLYVSGLDKSNTLLAEAEAVNAVL
jgi:superfamily I DNA and RNA helicase